MFKNCGQKSLHNILNHSAKKRQKWLCLTEIMHYQCVMNYCHPVVAIGVKKLNHAHKNHSFHTQSDFKIPPHDHNTCYLEVCMVDAIVILYAAHCVVVYCSSMLFMYCTFFFRFIFVRISWALQCNFSRELIKFVISHHHIASMADC